MDKKHRFAKLVHDWIHCERCGLHETRKNVVFARGSFDPLILFVGEAPGAEEDEKGRPFVGRSGQLLEELIQESGINEVPYAITNVLGCRPPNNVDPTIFEIMACKKRFEILLDILDPKILVVMGRIAARKIAGIQTISKWRGAVIDSDLVINNQVKVYKTVVTYHPSFLLRSGRDGPLRKEIVSDLKKARKAIDDYRRFGENLGDRED